MIKNIYSSLAIFVAICLASCNDHNFDWDEAHNQNPDVRYEAMFTSLYGNISPDQNWDLTVSKPQTTLATRVSKGDILAGLELAEMSGQPASSGTWCANNILEYDGGALPNPQQVAGKYSIVSQGKFLLCPIWHGNCGNYSLVITGTDGLTGRPVGDTYVISAEDLKTAMNYKTNITTTGAISNSDVKCAPMAFIIPYDEGTVVHLNLIMDGATETIPYETVDKNGNPMYSSLMATPSIGEYGQNNNLLHSYSGVIFFDDATNRNDNDKTKCGDADYNDLVILVESYGAYTEPEIVSRDDYQESSKRYMVEDMGYYIDHPSASDIDFNDIVVDFVQKNKFEVKTTIYNGAVTTQTIPLGITEQSIKIYAMGGTWDFEFGLIKGDEFEPMFQKSTASTTPNSDGYYVTFNPDYTIGGNEIDGITVKTMYNTGFGTDGNIDGNLHYDKYICEIKKQNAAGEPEFIDGWVELQNNVYFEVIGGYNSTLDPENVYFKDATRLTFPQEGDVPRIIAFPTTKEWKSERSPIDDAWIGQYAQ